ncbi:MAG: hypothetical protein MJZ40_03795 [Bacteroidaceae bacterium]|nr:hypothetical protein [Bacteroidaceae bacterium]
MKLLSTLVALASAVVCPLAAVAQGNPFEEQTKAVYIYSVNHGKFLSDYQSPTPNTYCLQDYGLSRVDAILFELTTLNAQTGESVLFTPWTATYMSVPAAGSFVKASSDAEQRSILTIKDAADGHKVMYSGTTLLSPYKNGAIQLLVGFTAAHQQAGWGKEEESLWDIVDAEHLEEFLLAHDIDPESDPYTNPNPGPGPGPDPDPDPDYTAAFEELASTLREANDLLFQIDGGLSATGEALVQSPEQLSSAYADEEEGADFGLLIDEDPFTFWHSDWHGNAPEGNHSLDVALPESCVATAFCAKYTGRLSGNNCAPVEMNVYGGHRSAEGIVWEASSFATLTREDGLGAFAGWGHSESADLLSGKFCFEADDLYDALRFEVVMVSSDSGEGQEDCFNYSEFQLYAAQKVNPSLTGVDAQVVTNLRALVEDARYLTKTDDPTELIELLRAAMAALNPEGIRINENANENANLYYDLQGRSYVRLPKSGLYIQNGRKVLK